MEVFNYACVIDNSMDCVKCSNCSLLSLLDKNASIGRNKFDIGIHTKNNKRTLNNLEEGS